MTAARPSTALLVSAGLLVWLHCAGSGRHYTPDTAWVAGLGPAGPAARLGALLAAAEGPIVYDLRISSQVLAFACRDAFVDEPSRFGSHDSAVHRYTCPRPGELRFAAIASIEVLQPSYVVTLRDAGQQRLLVTKLRTRADALALVDLLAWYRASAVQSTSAPALVVELTRTPSMATDKTSQ